MSINSEKRVSSQIISFASEDSNPLLFTNAHFYGALFEFCQGSLPQTIWEDGIASVSNYDAFKLFMVNTQAPTAPLSITKPEPTVVVSTYENLSYIAVYSFVLDVEAKMFQRPIVFVLANINPDIVTHVNFLYMNKILQIIEQIRKSAVDIFPGELKSYACSLMKCMEMHPERKEQLGKKMNELKQYLEMFKIKDLNAEEGKTKPPEYFLLVHNDLRPLNKIANLKTIVNDLDQFISVLPTSLLCSSIAVRGDVVESDPQFSFAGVDATHGFSTLAFKLFSHNYEDDRYSIRSFVKKTPGIFHYCAYGLLSGQTLVIISENNDIALSLARKFSILVPFFTPDLLVTKDTATTTECLKYSIVVLRKLVDDNAPNCVNVIDLDKNVYKGESCPLTSFVLTKLSKVVTVSERAFLIGLYSELKHISTDFVTALALVAKTEKTPESILNELKNFGLVKEDEPIFRYWISCFFNKEKCKPILRQSGNKLGICTLDFQ